MPGHRAQTPARLLFVAAAVALLVVGCQQPAAPSAAKPPAAPPAAAPAASAPQAPAQPAPQAPSEWDRLVAEAKKEGTVRIVLPPGIPGIVDAFTRAFEEEFGIKVEAS